MKWARGREAAQADLEPHLVFIRWTNLVLGFGRLCCALVELHKGVLDRASSWIHHAPHKEYLQQTLAGNGAVREGPGEGYQW